MRRLMQSLAAFDYALQAPVRVAAKVSLATSPTVTAATAIIGANAPYLPTLPLTVVSPNDLTGTIRPPSAGQKYWTLAVTSKSVLPAYLLSGQVSTPAKGSVAGITGSLDCSFAAILPVSLLPRAGRSLHGHVQMGGVFTHGCSVAHTGVVGPEPRWQPASATGQPASTVCSTGASACMLMGLNAPHGHRPLAGVYSAL